ncbi:MAG TPA: class I SAM-dependent methyltransferase [Longimicrobium sp.]|jgi:SAM-dependent methyltransferase
MTSQLSLWSAYRLGVRLGSRWPGTAARRLRRVASLLRYPPNLVAWLTPIDYVRWRELEFALAAVRRFKPDARSVLDISSPKLLPVTLAAALPGAAVRATDIVDDEVAHARRAAAELGLRNLAAELADARALEYADGSFDLITSVSVFEHIAPERDGDVPAAREMGRVLAPGGIAVLTVPFAREYFAEYRAGSVYERQAGGDERIFFQRFYNEATLRRGIVDPSGLEVVSLEFIDERHFSADPHTRMAHYVNATAWQKLVFGLWYYPLSRVFLSPPRPLAQCGKPYLACVVLRKAGIRD